MLGTVLLVPLELLAVVLFDITDGVERGSVLINWDDQSLATVIQILSETQLETEPLADGLNNDWEVGDTYKLYNQVQVNISGGNLVAVDDVGDNINPVCPTTFVQVIRTSASSATSIFSQDIFLPKSLDRQQHK